MSNNSNPFSFGSGSTNTSNLFGQASSSTNKPLFGQPTTSSSTNAATTSTAGQSGPTQTSNIFANMNASSQAPTTGGLFSNLNATSGAQKPSVFGSNPSASTPAGGTPLFGGSAANTSGGSNIFGSGSAGNSGGSSNQQSSIFGSSTGTSGFNFGQNKDSPTTGSQTTATKPEASQQSSILTGGAKPGASLFGNIPNTSTSNAAGSTTPAPTKIANPLNFAASTTPAGPPPAENTGTKTATPSLFGSITQPSSGGLFSGQKPSDTATSKPQQGGGFFGSSGTTTSSTPNLFGASTTPSSSAAAAPATSSSTTPASKPTFSFGPLASTASQGQTMAAPAASATPSLFGTASAAKPSSDTSTPKPATAGGVGNVTSSSTTPSLFSGLGQTPSTTAPATSSGATSGPTTSVATPSLFKPTTGQTTNGTFTTTTAESQASTATAGASTAPTGTSAAAPLGASTAGPAPQLSRLKNKTIDEIITRWASDLSKYQKEFQEQAAKVAQWDRLLVENGDKIQKLYSRTYEAERATAEVERQLTAVESHQEELSGWLDRYEAEVDDMFARQLGPGEALQGPDQEREKTYRLAEKLTDRLDEMGKDLTNMIQEINTASATLSRTSKPDDPLSQIVRVLNGHLAQLQWIDQNTASLQAKVAAAQKATQSIISNGGGDNDPAEELFKSYLGRR